MNEDLTGRTDLVPGYAGYADRPASRLSDQQVRAWVGEILADLRRRLPSDELRDRIDALLFRCEFGDQHVIRAIEDGRFEGHGAAETVEACDRTVIEAANRLRAAGPGEPAAALDELERAFNERAETITSWLKR